MLADADADGLDADAEDTEVPNLVSAGLAARIAERGEGSGAFTLDAPPTSKPPLHARLRRTLDAEIEDEAHWAFRAIGASRYRRVQI